MASRIGRDFCRERDRGNAGRRDKSRRAVTEGHGGDVLGNGLDTVASRRCGDRTSCDSSSLGGGADSGVGRGVNKCHAGLVSSRAVGNINSAGGNSEGLCVSNSRSD